MKNSPATKIKIDYKNGLGSYLDEKNIQWEQINEDEIFLILTHLENFNMYAYLFEIGIRFEEWRQEIE